MENSRSFQAGAEAARAGNNINNSYPFKHDEFCAGYKSVKPDAKTILDECNTPEERLWVLKMIEMAGND